MPPAAARGPGAVPVDERFEAAALAFGGAAFGGGVGAADGPRLPLEAQARMVGAYQWIERRLFEVLGSWSASESVPEAQLVFDVYSAQHAWHADLLGERLPVLDAVDPDTLAVPPSVEVDRMLGVLAGNLPLAPGVDVTMPGVTVPGAGGTLLRVVGMARVVLPRLVSGYGLHLRRLDAVSDAALARTLRLVLHDEVEQWQAMEALAEAFLRRPHDIAVVTSYQQQLEQMVAGPGAGFVAWPTGPPPGAEGGWGTGGPGADAPGADGTPPPPPSAPVPGAEPAPPAPVPEATFATPGAPVTPPTGSAPAEDERSGPFLPPPPRRGGAGAPAAPPPGPPGPWVHPPTAPD